MADGEIQWYYRLNSQGNNQSEDDQSEDNTTQGGYNNDSCLMDSYKGKYIVQKMSEYNGVCYRKYGELSGAVSILDLIIQCPECCFFEVALGSQPQKFRLDLDIPIQKGDGPLPVKDEIKFLEECIDSIVNVGKMCNCDIVPSRDIYLFSSHGEEKRSYHIVLCGFYFSDNEECNTFYLHFKDNKRPNALDKYIDDSVYSKVQCFRLLGCSKIGQKRIKILCRGWWYGGVYIDQHLRATKKDKMGDNKINSIDIMEKSLLTYITNDIRVSVPSHVRKPKYTNNDIIDRGASIFTDELVELAKEKFEKWSDGSMVFLRVSDDMRYILYKRERPSFCNGCKRVHHAENGFIYLHSNTFIYDCRRGSKQPIDSLPLSYILSDASKEGTTRQNKSKSSKVHGPRHRFCLLRLGNKERIYNSDTGRYIYQDISADKKTMVQKKLSFAFRKGALEKKSRCF